MNQYKRSYYIQSALLLIAALTSSCLDMGGNGRALSPLVKASSDAVSGTITPATDQASMWVKVKAGTKDLKVHRVTKPGTSLTDPTDVSVACSITVTGSPQDFTCIAEVEELDLFYNGIDISYNIPGTVCNYTRISPYWYFRYQVGRGAAYVIQKFPLVGSPTVQVGDDAVSAAAAAPSVSPDTYANIQCPFNYSSFGGPNCCLGTYTLSTQQEAAPGGTFNTSNTLGNAWGGDASKCVDGPGADTSIYKRDPVFRTPMPNYFNIEGSGISGDVVTASSYKRQYKTNIFNANFFNPSDHGGSTPQPLNEITFANASEFSATPSAAYTFECLDRSSLLKHRIQLYVREWNEALQLQLFTQGQTGTSSDTTANSVNDFKDWLDMSPTASGGYPMNKQ